MAGYNKTRDPASSALIELREKMGMTQAQFAVQVLNKAVTTIARYETSHRPPPEVLLRLRGVAHEQALEGLADHFSKLWLEDMHALLGDEARTILIAEGGKRGLLIASLNSPEAIRSAADYLTILGQLASNDPKHEGKVDPKYRQAALRTFKGIQKTARLGKGKLEKEIEDVFLGKHK